MASRLERIERLERAFKVRRRPAAPFSIAMLYGDDGQPLPLFAVDEAAPAWPLRIVRTWRREAAETEDAFMARIEEGAAPGALLMGAAP